MSYYQLPKTNILIHSYIDYIVSDETPTSYISNSLSSYLYEIKQRLETIETEWDTYKKYTNPYEYIHTHVPNKKKMYFEISSTITSLF